MTDKLDNLKNVWKDARQVTPKPALDLAGIIHIAQKRKSSAIRMHVLNILVLVVTLIGLVLFFSFVARFNQLISHIGTALMVGGLTLRIIIEGYSIYLSSKIDLSESSIVTNNAFLRFYRFRQTIHGPVTMVILILYTIGFYMLTPEFSLFFSPMVMILIDLSYVAGAAIVTIAIRKAIKKEMGFLDEIKKLHEQMTEQ
jgi:hypothetical protein